MKRFLPKSLVGQLLLLVALTLLIAQGINMLLLYRGVGNQNLAAAASTAIGRIASDLDRMENSGRTDRRPRHRGRRGTSRETESSFVTPAMERLPNLESRAAEALVNMGFDIRAVQIAGVEALPSNLPPNMTMNRSRAPRRGHVDRVMGRGPRGKISGYLLISIQKADSRWISIASAVRDRGPVAIWRLLFQTVILYLILLVPLIILGRYISKPLKTLTASAENFQPGSQLAVKETGPPDVQNLIAAFNNMRTRVSTMLNEKDVMLGAIGHDLRTPLAALRVRIEGVEDQAERGRMIAGIEEMDIMLDDILSLARVGRSAEVAENTDVMALIETVVHEFADIGNDVTFERGNRIAAVLKPTLVRRALRNLIGNAVKYGEFAIVAVEDSVDNLVIHVDDNGPGLADADIEKMFEPFVRAEQSRNRKTGGSGLGLTLARAIARDHGGDVVISNRSEGGLRASMTLAVNPDR